VQLEANWETLATKVISVVLNDPGAIVTVSGIIGHNIHWFPVVHHPVYRSMLICQDANVAPNVTTVSARSGGELSTTYLEALAHTYTDTASRDLEQNAQALKDVGLVFEARGIGEVLSSITRPEELGNITSYVEMSLSGITANRTHRDPNAKAVSEAAHQFEGSIIPTGLTWLDDLIGGLYTGQITWIAARYKGGKSTLLRNLVIAACRAGHHSQVFAAEGSREGFAIDVQVMLAVEHMIDVLGYDPAEIYLSRLKVKRSVLQPDKVRLHPDEIKALAHAKSEFENWPIQVYDAQDGINDLVTLAFKAKTGKLEYSTEAIFLDYAQLFSLAGVSGIYEQAAATAIFLQKLAAQQDLSVTVIAQLNQGGVRDTGKGGHVAAISGGGTAAATADYLFQPDIVRPEGQKFAVMRVPLTHSRHSEPARGAHIVHPQSGLFIDRYLDINPMTLSEMADIASAEGEQWVGHGIAR
jgi:replicative DNA helicase